jgi:biofilm protein TabA
LKNTDLTKLELKKLELDGTNLFVSPSEYTTKNPEEANFEAHRKYIDIQYVVSGKELIGVAPLTAAKAVVTPYDATKDVEFLSFGETKNYKASQERVFIFFPSDAHRPNLKDGENSKVRKVVVKVRVD